MSILSDLLDRLKHGLGAVENTVANTAQTVGQDVSSTVNNIVHGTEQAAQQVPQEIGNIFHAVAQQRQQNVQQQQQFFQQHPIFGAVNAVTSHVNPAALGADIFHGVTDSALSTGLSFVQGVENAAGRGNNDLAYQPNDPVSKALFGNDTVKSIQLMQKQGSQTLQNFGLGKGASNVLAGVGVPAFTILGMDPGVSGAEKGAAIAVEDIAKQVFKAPEAQHALLSELIRLQDTSPQAIEGVIRSVAEQAGQNAPRSVKAIASKLSELATTQAAPGAAGTIEDTLKTIDQAAQDTTKPGIKLAKKKRTIPGVSENNLNPIGQQELPQLVDQVKADLTKLKGKPLKQKEVLTRAKKAALLEHTIGREATAELTASMEATDQYITQALNNRVRNGETGFPLEVIQASERLSSQTTHVARALASRRDSLGGEAKTLAEQVLSDLTKLNHSAEDIQKAFGGVDLTNAKQVAKAFRSLEPASMRDLLSEYRYTNLLSGPGTHAKNFFTNLGQTFFTRPAVLGAQSLAEPITSRLGHRPQEAYLSSVPHYYRGVIQSIPDALKAVADVFAGRAPALSHEASKFQDALEGVGQATHMHLPSSGSHPNTIIGNTVGAGISKFVNAPVINRVTDLLEASDQFFKTLVHGGELAHLQNTAVKNGQELTPELVKTLSSQAKDTATNLLFRQASDAKNETGQGHLLSFIDGFSEIAYRLRDKPGGRILVPFITTPMNIAKQMIEYSPAGVATLPGNAHKTEQAAKAFVGSTVMAGAGWLAANHETTLAAPTNPADKNAFYASGRIPYAINIGGNWYSYDKLGPMGMPILLAVAIKDEITQHPDDGTLKKMEMVVGDAAKYFFDQTYVQAMGDALSLAQGDASKLTNLASMPIVQNIPIESLLSQVNRTFIDRTSRHPTNPVEQVESNLPGLSQNVQPYKDAFGNPESRGTLGTTTASLLLPANVSPAQDASNPNEQLFQQRQANTLQNRQDKALLQQFQSQDQTDNGSGQATTQDNQIKYLDNGNVKTIDLNPLISQPSGSVAAGKLNSEKMNTAVQIYRLMESGKIPQDQAQNAFDALGIDSQTVQYTTAAKDLPTTDQAQFALQELQNLPTDPQQQMAQFKKMADTGLLTTATVNSMYDQHLIDIQTLDQLRTILSSFSTASSDLSAYRKTLKGTGSRGGSSRGASLTIAKSTHKAPGFSTSNLFPKSSGSTISFGGASKTNGTPSLPNIKITPPPKLKKLSK